MATSGWEGDGGLEICEKETFIFQTFFYTVIFWGACEHVAFTTFIRKNN